MPWPKPGARCSTSIATTRCRGLSRSPTASSCAGADGHNARPSRTPRLAAMPYNLSIPGQVSEFQLRAIECVAALVPPGGHVVEVGSLFGCSSWAWARSVDPSVTVHCIDPWEKNEGVRLMEARYGVTYGVEQF